MRFNITIPLFLKSNTLNYIFFRENKALSLIASTVATSQYDEVSSLSQISRNFAKNGVKSFAFRENLKTQKYSHSKMAVFRGFKMTKIDFT